MAVISWPEEFRYGKAEVCALCAQKVELHNATIGPRQGQGRRPLLCNSHLYWGRGLTRGLSEYNIKQKSQDLTAEITRDIRNASLVV